MGRAEFEEYSLNGILGRSKTVAETIKESAGVLTGLFEEAECEFSSVREELSRTVHLVQEKLFYAQQERGDCGRQIEACERGYVRSDGKDEAERQKQERQNAEIDRKIETLQQAGSEMDKSISVLEKNLETLRRLEKELAASKSKFDAERAGNTVKLQRAVSNGNRFYLAVENAYERAMEIVNFKDSALSVQLHGNTFKIDPTGHDGMIKRDRRAFHDISDAGAIRTELGMDGKDDVAVAPSGVTMILEDTTPEQFLSRIDASEAAAWITVKAPSYNLHKLGGVKIIEEMESRGFQVKRDGGSMIGSDGYVTWEKRR